MNLNQFLDTHEQETFLKALHSFSDRCIRLHVRRVETELPFAVTQVPWYPWGRFLVDSKLRPASFLNYATADYYIQDAASLLSLALLDPQATDKICDLCASPGGKASAIAERLGPDGFLLANESIRSRVDVLRYSLARTGNPCFAVSSYDPEILANQMPRTFDAVLVDAPCSGQTLVGRNKRDDNAFSKNQIEHCALRQQRILQSAVQLLKLGGRLIYSTCTFSTEENESQIQWLQEQFPGAWEPIEPLEIAPWQSPVRAGCYRLWPHRDHCAGGFAAGLRLVKEIEFEPNGMSSRGTKHREIPIAGNTKQRSEMDKQKSVKEVLGLLGEFTNVTTEWQRGYAQCMTPGALQSTKNFPQLAMEPMAVLIETGNHFVPTQGLALLDNKFFRPNRILELVEHQAKLFASGVSIGIGSEPHQSRSKTESRWTIATFNSRPLGWCKVLSNRLNNHLPPWARLNMG